MTFNIDYYYRGMPEHRWDEFLDVPMMDLARIIDDLIKNDNVHSITIIKNEIHKS
jgi:hypothetical protein